MLAEGERLTVEMLDRVFLRAGELLGGRFAA